MNLYPHQKETLERSEGLNRVAYYWDMGLGKTFIGSEKLIQLQTKRNIVVCQKTKINDWMDHFRINYPGVGLFDLTKKALLDCFIYWEDASPRMMIGFINYDLIFRRGDLKKLSDFTLLLDESSLIQNHTAKRTKFILNLKPANVILLSGTPVSGKYENLWSQIHLLGWDISEKLYQRQYVNWEKVEEGGLIFNRVNKQNPYKHVDRLKEKLREHGAFFLKTEECFQLPEQTFTEIKIPTPKEYRQFQKHKIITINDETLVGDHVFKEILYSRQICTVYNPAKLEAFKDLVESTKDRLIVFYSFNRELEKLKQILTDLERPISEVNGSVKDLTAYEHESDSVTLIQYQAGAMGLNLQKANKIIYFSLTDKSELFEQSKKRIHRIGQKKPCFYYLMICPRTVEEWMLETLEERKDFTDELFKDKERKHGS